MLKPPSRWIKQSARFSRFLADRGIIVSMVYVLSLLLGMVAVAFAMLADKAIKWNNEFYANHTFLALLLPPIVFPVVVWLVKNYFWGSEGSGIPQAIKVIKHPKPRIMTHLLGPRSMLGKFILTPFVLAAGAAAGREGPTVQIGATLLAYSRRWPGIAKVFDTRSLIICGGAAGVAAAFNTPLGGLMFAFEELGSRRVIKHTSSLLMAVVLSGLVALSIQGNYSYFGYSNATIDWRQEWFPILVLAICTGIIGGLYARSMLVLVSDRGFWGDYRKRHPYRFACACGIVLSLMALVFGHHVMGAGYEDTKMALQESQDLPATYWLTKMVATVVSFVSGVPGGLFSPTLSIGAGFGHFFANLIHQDTAPFMMLAMVGVMSAVTHCPITAFVIVLEMVDNHELVMPLIFVSAIATQVSRRIIPASVYHMLANNIRLSFAQPEPQETTAVQSEEPVQAETPANAVQIDPVSLPPTVNETRIDKG